MVEADFYRSKLSVVVVDDDVVDAKALRRSFGRSELDFPLFFEEDGIEALKLLRGAEGKERPSRPFLVLLDINMPRMNGIEFLKELRADPALRDTVVFVLTTSRAEDDKIAAYAHNVAGYIVKSDVGDHFDKLITLLRCYNDLVRLP